MPNESSESLIKLNHLAIVVDDLDAALCFWGDSLGLAAVGERQTLPDEAVEIAFLALDDARIELIAPTTDDSGVAKYLAKRGPGMHHLCLEVPDLEAKLAELAERGCQLINETPRQRDGRRYAFVHPASAAGVLLELYEQVDAD